MTLGKLRSWISPAIFVLVSFEPAWGQEHLPVPGADHGSVAAPPHPVAEAAACTGPCEGSKFGGGFFVDVEYLYLQPRRRAQDFAIIDPNLAGTAVGSIESVNWSSNSGYGIGAGYRIGNQGWFVAAHYMYFHSGNDRTLNSPAGGTLIATMTHPGFVDLVDSAVGTSTINYNVLDVDFGRKYYPCDSFQFGWTAGGRFAWIDQGLNAFYVGNTANQSVVSSPVDFNGCGVRVGGDAQWFFGRGFGLYAQAAGSLLAGDFRTSLVETNNAGATVITNVSDRYRKVVPVAEIGIGGVYQREHFRARIGYYITNWFGMVDSPDIIHDFSNKLSHRTSDLSLDGLLVQLAFAY